MGLNRSRPNGEGGVNGLNRLERLGWTVLAERHLSLTPGESRVLAHLTLDRPDGVCTYDCLAGHLNLQDGTASVARRRLPTRIARIRRALRDLGLPSSSVQNVSEVGYRIGADSARRIRGLVEAAA